MRFRNGSNEESLATKSQALSVPAIEVPSRINTLPVPLGLGRKATTA